MTLLLINNKINKHYQERQCWNTKIIYLSQNYKIFIIFQVRLFRKIKFLKTITFIIMLAMLK